MVIIGAGPAGLTAAHELHKAGLRSVILEKDAAVGGLARTVCFKGFRFDIGGHRFFTKVEAVDRLWHEVLGSEFQRRSRLSRIYFKGRYFDYPLRLTNVVRGLGLTTSLRALISYLKAHAKPRLPEANLEDYVINRFGQVLYETFFKTYTEKVWGMPCHEIGAEWAAQRIRGLSMYRAIMAALLPNRARKIKSLIDSFRYPRLGPGQMWETITAGMNAAGNPVLSNMEVVSIRHAGNRILEIVAGNGSESRSFPASEVISSMPLRDLIERLDPPAPPEIVKRAGSLRYRDFLTVALIINAPSLFRDNWIYIHDPSVKVGRVQNYGNWSPDLVPEPDHSCLGLEYFCSEGDDLWAMDENGLLELARKEAVLLKLCDPRRIIDGTVVRMKKAYPAYDADYQHNLRALRDYLARFSNLHPVGRNGLHKYNNQDHSMFTAMLAVRNIRGEQHDVWSVNADCEYHEEIPAERSRILYVDNALADDSIKELATNSTNFSD